MPARPTSIGATGNWGIGDIMGKGATLHPCFWSRCALHGPKRGVPVLRRVRELGGPAAAPGPSAMRTPKPSPAT